MIQEAYDELDCDRINVVEELKFTQRLTKYPDEYTDHVRTGILAKLLGKDKGDLVYWYETFTEVYVKSKQCCKKKKGYSVKPENLNLDGYKGLLLNKLTDSLEIAGFKMDDLRLQLSHETTISVNRFRGASRMSDSRQTIVVDDIIKNFPFPTVRDSQTSVLKEIDAALASDYKYILLEAPTGFGKSPVAIATTLTLGTRYICTSTKDLQTQYAKDFPFLKVAKGKNNFPCLVKHDFIRNGTFKCGLDSNSAKCRHTTADYGPCINNESFKNSGCKYKTHRKHYKINNKGTREEEVLF